jgi:YidC/Oxa1 family membrane protein insertase
MFISANIFQPLIDVFQSVLTFFHNSLGVQWGWSIVLLTICVRAVLLPLTVKQFHSMQKMQQLAPEMKAIQAKYKEDKERQNQEMMRFYKENGVNPLGSCLPLVLQLPVFISLYYMLRTSLRVDICPAIQRVHNHGVLSTAHTVPCGPHGGASFLFIPDLTNKASGTVLIVLIVLYVGTQLASSMMMASPTMDPTQRKLMMFLPLLFVLFVINFPAGVLVYWITTNTWTMCQQFIIKRRIGPVTPVGASVAAAGGAAGVVATSGKRPPPPTKDGAKDGTKTGATGAVKNATKADGDGGSNGSGSGGLSGLLRGRAKPKTDAETVTTRAPSGPPPRPPRKKKKRSGRRR